MKNKANTAIKNARVGEVLGFITENCKAQHEFDNIFPTIDIDIAAIIKRLKTRELLLPYGDYNNNYLTEDNDKLIYSDDSDLARIVYNAAVMFTDPKTFANNLGLMLQAHWLKMKKSGEYGVDGLYYGKRGYSKTTLQVLADLYSKNSESEDWYLADKKFIAHTGNGSVLRSWVIGLNANISPEQAYNLGYIQSLITHPDQDIAIAAGSIAQIFSSLLHRNYSSKSEIAMELIDLLKSKCKSCSLALEYSLLALKLYEEKIQPAHVYSSYFGRTYHEFLLLVLYSFLHFDSFEQALLCRVKSVGDNDSILFLLGALFGAYNGEEDFVGFLNYIEDNHIIQDMQILRP